jgi:hypothetical protein
MMSPDFRDLLAAFNAHGVEFLVVGAYALAAHGFVRAIKDLDVRVRPDSANAERVIEKSYSSLMQICRVVSTPACAAGRDYKACTLFISC